MNNPKVSVVITCYNYGKYLCGCLDSVLSQTYTNIEVIVVDDGSTDETHEVMLAYLPDPRIQYIFQSNRGQTVAKNVGISHCRSEFIAFLDADDQWCPEKLEKQMNRFCDSSVGVVFCRAKYLDPDSAPLEYVMSGRYLQPRRGTVTDWLIFDNFVQFSSVVLRKECIESFGLFDESLKMGIDWDMWLKISTKYAFDYVDEQLFYYRMGHSGQMSKNLEERFRCSDRITNVFLSKYGHLLSKRTIRRAFAYTYCCRGEYLRTKNKWGSTKFFLKAVFKNPTELGAYKGVVKNLLSIL
ncbi:glycosyltransferase family 2 protein [Geomonas oryzae]|uniref:glycosyltransferase family 2 protein n=1 Tax=Geomonas oryzae TaxID=2364273 RepID=UPI00100A59BC|nr:glycosyltransferase family 2 protein [Geomonas oryzae]